MKINFIKYLDYHIVEEDESIMIRPTIEASVKGNKDKEFLSVNMTDALSKEDNLLDVNNTDRRMYNELIALAYDKYGNEKDFEDIQESILKFVKKYGNIGSSIIEVEEEIAFEPTYSYVSIAGRSIPYMLGISQSKEISAIGRRKRSLLYKDAFIVNPDCLCYKGDWLGCTVFADIFDLKTLVEEYNDPTKRINVDLINKHLLECNITEIFDYNENGELVLTAFFDTIIGLAYWQLKNDIATNMNIKQCAHCGKYFTAKNPKAKYCQNRRDESGNSQCAIAARNKVGNLRRKVRTEARKGTPLETLLATIKDLDKETIETEYKKIVRK